MKKYVDKFIKEGIVTIPNVFTEEECAEMKLGAYRAKQKGNPHYQHSYINYTPNGFPSVMLWPTLVDDYLNKIRTDERMQEIVRTLLGNEVKQLNNQVYFREPGDDDQFAWHQDVVFRIPKERHPDIVGNYIQTVIAVDDITIENGAIEFIPESHKQGIIPKAEMIRKFERGQLRGKKYTAPKGSVMIWDLLTIHGSEVNVSDQQRMTYMNGFARSENALDWPIYLIKGEIVEKADHTLIP